MTGKRYCIYVDRLQPSNMRSEGAPSRCLHCGAVLVEGRYGWRHTDCGCGMGDECQADNYGR